MRSRNPLDRKNRAMGHETINALELQEPALHTSSGNPQEDPINIAYCFDKNYRQHFAASICSLITNANEFRALNIFIVTDAADAVFKSKIEIIIPPTKTRRITWIIIDEALVGGLPLDGKRTSPPRSTTGYCCHHCYRVM